MTIKVAAPCLLALVAGACQVFGEDVPARLSGDVASGQLALQETINAAMGSDVLLADSALTTSHRLLIENRPPRTIDRPDPTGRTMEKPVVFELVKRGSRCILINTRSKERHVLDGISCVELAPE